MPKQNIPLRENIFRALFIIIAVMLITWFFPHNESFRYDYEVGKPWRYGRLTAPYDFPIYRSDSALMQMEDSLRRQIVPRYYLDAEIADQSLREMQAADSRVKGEAGQHLRKVLLRIYRRGILSGTDYAELTRLRIPQITLIQEDATMTVPTAEILSELQAYELLRRDTTYAALYSTMGIQRYIHSNLVADTATMRLEYARLRQQVSATSGVVLAESRIIDRGEIVTPQTYDILESYRREQQQRLSLTSSDTLMYLGRLGLVALVLCSVLLFLRLYRPWLYMQQNEVLVAIGAISFMVVLTSLANSFLVGAVYMVPIGIVTILLSTFHGSRTAYYCHIVMVLLCSFIAPSHFEYLIIQCLVGMVIVFSLKDGLEDRSQLMHVCILSALTYVGIYALYTLATEGALTNISWRIITMMTINSILLLLSYLIIYVLENLFGFMSGVTLIELCNVGKGPLLRLSKDARGTFQHCTQVANLAAKAAKEIGANPSLVRTGAMYHDIGKLWNPQYYTENQDGVNPHDKLSLEESVDLIKRHVVEGIKIAEKEKLPNDIIDFIKTHHGRSMAKYFYIKWCNEHPDQQPDAEFFTYPGPDPTSREQAILMMADAIEAASKSLKDYSRVALTTLVKNITQEMISSGRFDNAKITLKEIQTCRESFIEDLQAIYHARIAYPERNEK